MNEAAESPFTVVVCTRNRPEHLARTLDSLAAQSWLGFDVLVVDQSDDPDPELARRADSWPPLMTVSDEGRGLSRSRNLAWRALATDWIVYLDDDCRPEVDWALALRETLVSRADVDYVSGHVGGDMRPPGDYLLVTVYPVEEERLRQGRWTRPWHIGFGVCMAIRRSTIEVLGGWDEHLGPGASFPAADDMDFNYRFLKAGGRALATPHARAHHHQWRAPDDLGPLFRGYMMAWSGFAMKHLRSGDVVGGAWLWCWGVVDVARMAASAVRRRSWLRLRVTAYKVHGLVSGTVRGLTYRW